MATNKVIPKFTVYQQDDVYVINIISGKYKGVKFSYKDIDIIDDKMSYYHQLILIYTIRNNIIPMINL